ncbi:hypothetical protein MPSEU_000147100 [Mayamaea pseudoterrestris]|nr:hypothetical protein MPSEU_000147100 [Mayamaea pseudoterrestris]
MNYSATLLLVLLLGYLHVANAFHVQSQSTTRASSLFVALSPPKNELPITAFATRSFVKPKRPSTASVRNDISNQLAATISIRRPVNSNQVAWERGKEVIGLVFGQVICPLVTTFLSSGMVNETDFWETSRNNMSNADRVVKTIEDLGCTYVKFGQALASRPDLVPAPLAKALLKLQDDMEPFPTGIARDIIVQELLHCSSNVSAKDLGLLLSSLSATPVAAASIGQVYKGHMPGFGFVAIKVRRPDIQETIARDAALLKSVAFAIESIKIGSKQLVKTKLVDAVNEFMSRLDEELDYRNEASNIRKFSDLYSHRRAASNNDNSSKVRVVVPQVLDNLCTDNVLVMEWIEGSKLTDVDHKDPKLIRENLALIQMGIECTLSQLLETGVLHADPHAANLIKVPHENNKGARLGYLDFGLLSTVPETVRDALVCSVAQLVFARDVDAVASLFGELQLLPAHVASDPERALALAQALDSTFQQVLEYPEFASKDPKTSTRIPNLRFDRLLESLGGILPEFEFKLPPYFLSNCRALAIMEGNARMLDPQFNVLQVLYPYALNRLLLNPSGSNVVEATLWSLLTDPQTNAVDGQRVFQLLDDSSAMTGYSRRKVLRDILSTRKGRQVARAVAVQLGKGQISRRRRKRRVKASHFFRL